MRLLPLKQLVPGLRVADHITKTLTRFPVVASALRLNINTAATDTGRKMTFNAELFEVKEAGASEEYHLRVGLSGADSHLLTLAEQEVSDVIGPDGFALLAEDMKEVLAANRCTLQVVGPGETKPGEQPTMMHCILAFDKSVIEGPKQD